MGSKYQLAPIHFHCFFFPLLFLIFSLRPPSFYIHTYIYIPPTLTVQYKMLKRQKKRKSGWTEKRKAQVSGPNFVFFPSLSLSLAMLSTSVNLFLISFSIHPNSWFWCSYYFLSNTHSTGIGFCFEKKVGPLLLLLPKRKRKEWKGEKKFERH